MPGSVRGNRFFPGSRGHRLIEESATVTDRPTSSPASLSVVEKPRNRHFLSLIAIVLGCYPLDRAGAIFPSLALDRLLRNAVFRQPVGGAGKPRRGASNFSRCPEMGGFFRIGRKLAYCGEEYKEFDADDRSGWSIQGHLEKFEVPVRDRDVPPFSITQVIENEANWKPRFRFA